MDGVILICSSCSNGRERAGQRYCLACHAAYMREWRKTHKLTGEARKKALARTHAGIAHRRGQLTAMPCEMCGAEDVQRHHEDYDKPLDVTWLCRPCHLDLHYGERANV